MTYTVKYRCPGQLFWRTIKRVIGDGIQAECGFTWFVLQDNSAIRIPITSEVKFSKERVISTVEKMRAESGQNITLNT